MERPREVASFGIASTTARIFLVEPSGFQVVLGDRFALVGSKPRWPLVRNAGLREGRPVPLVFLFMTLLARAAARRRFKILEKSNRLWVSQEPVP
jgi:hypothetical protein